MATAPAVVPAAPEPAAEPAAEPGRRRRRSPSRCRRRSSSRCRRRADGAAGGARAGGRAGRRARRRPRRKRARRRRPKSPRPSTRRPLRAVHHGVGRQEDAVPELRAALWSCGSTRRVQGGPDRPPVFRPAAGIPGRAVNFCIRTSGARGVCVEARRLRRGWRKLDSEATDTRASSFVNYPSTSAASLARRAVFHRRKSVITP